MHRHAATCILPFISIEIHLLSMSASWMPTADGSSGPIRWEKRPKSHCLPAKSKALFWIRQILGLPRLALT